MPRRPHAWMLLGFLGLASLPSAPGTAWAQESSEATLFEGLFVELLPIGDLPGDGATPVTLNLMTLDETGAPLVGVEVKTKLTAGSLSEPTEVQPGIQQFTFTPPQVDQTSEVMVSLKGQTADKRKFKRTWTFVVEPPVSQQVAVAISPQQLTLQEGATASLDVSFVGGSPKFREGAQLVLRANTGTIENLTTMGDGVYAALYRAPETDVPQVAVITAVDGRDPTRTYGHVALPLTAPKDLAVETDPGAKVLVKVGDREFGPEPTDRRGRATVSIVVPPGVTTGTLITLKDNARAESEVDLEIPDTPRLELFGSYPDLPGDANLDLPLRVAVVRADGSPDPSADLVVEAEGAAFSAPVHEGGGVYRVDLDPAAASGVVETMVRAGLRADEARVEMPVRLVPVRPASLALVPAPETLPKDLKEFTVAATLRDAEGNGLSERGVAFTTAGARLREVEDHGDGTYTATFDRTGRGPAELLATAKAPASTNPVRQLVVLPQKDRLPPDGLSSTAVTVLAVDEFGYPVAGIPIGLTLLRGDGKLPPKAQTDDAGMAQVQYTAGRAVGLVKLRVEAGGRVQTVPLFQLPPDALPELAIPLSGTDFEANLIESWRPIVQPLRLEKAR